MTTEHLVLPRRLGARNRVGAPRTGEARGRCRSGGIVAPQPLDGAAGFAADPAMLAAHGTVAAPRDAFGVAA